MFEGGWFRIFIIEMRITLIIISNPTQLTGISTTAGLTTTARIITTAGVTTTPGVTTTAGVITTA